MDNRKKQSNSEKKKAEVEKLLKPCTTKGCSNKTLRVFCAECEKEELRKWEEQKIRPTYHVECRLLGEIRGVYLFEIVAGGPVMIGLVHPRLEEQFDRRGAVLGFRRVSPAQIRAGDCFADFFISHPSGDLDETFSPDRADYLTIDSAVAINEYNGNIVTYEMCGGDCSMTDMSLSADVWKVHFFD